MFDPKPTSSFCLEKLPHINPHVYNNITVPTDQDILPASVEQVDMSKADNNISGRLALVTGASGG